jgi:hypothetical protein
MPVDPLVKRKVSQANPPPLAPPPQYIHENQGTGIEHEGTGICFEALSPFAEDISRCCTLESGDQARSVSFRACALTPLLG